MNICILDGYTTNPGDVSWAPLEALGNVTIYEFTKPEDIAALNAEFGYDQPFLVRFFNYIGDIIFHFSQIRLCKIL